MLTLTTRRRFSLFIAIAAVIAVAAFGISRWRFQVSPYSPSRLSFDGDSTKLQQTIIVPTLDSPIPEDRSIIWCVSFQLAWNELKNSVVKEPVLVANAQPIADRLNQSPQSKDDLDSDMAYAAAGFVQDGIVKRIQDEMARKFPDVSAATFDASDSAAVAYGYLAVSSQFELPYFENEDLFIFTDSKGVQTAVTSFGVREKDEYAYHRLREQVQVLYCPKDEIWRGEVSEFILDLCKTSDPYQIVLARIDRKSTLAETIAEVDRKIASQRKDREAMELGNVFGVRDTLLVPNIAWKITHHFKELEGEDKRLLNSALRGLYIDAAMQMIQFRLDRSGAELASESKVYMKPGASYFHVNRPFLLYMKKRDSEHPFLVTWIENAELLQKH